MKPSTPKTHAHDHFAQCEREHGTAVAALASADATYTRAAAAYDAALSQGREAALAARRFQIDAEVDRDIARRSVDTASARLDTARAAVTAAETERLGAVALASIREFETVAIRDYKGVILAVRRIARLWAEAQIARDEAIRGGVKEIDLPEVEGFRAVPDLPRKVIETNRVLWPVCPRTGDPRPDDEPRRVRSGDMGSHVHVVAGGSAEDDRVAFDRSVVLEAQRGARFVSLIETLVVPGLMADDVAGWTPPDYSSAAAVLAHLAILESAPATDRTDRRPRKIEMRRVPESELPPVAAHPRASEAA